MYDGEQIRIKIGSQISETFSTHRGIRWYLIMWTFQPGYGYSSERHSNIKLGL